MSGPRFQVSGLEEMFKDIDRTAQRLTERLERIETVNSRTEIMHEQLSTARQDIKELRTHMSDCNVKISELTFQQKNFRDSVSQTTVTLSQKIDKGSNDLLLQGDNNNQERNRVNEKLESFSIRIHSHDELISRNERQATEWNDQVRTANRDLRRDFENLSIRIHSHDELISRNERQATEWNNQVRTANRDLRRDFENQSERVRTLEGLSQRLGGPEGLSQKLSHLDTLSQVIGGTEGLSQKIICLEVVAQRLNNMEATLDLLRMEIERLKGRNVILDQRTRRLHQAQFCCSLQ